MPPEEQSKLLLQGQEIDFVLARKHLATWAMNKELFTFLKLENQTKVL